MVWAVLPRVVLRRLARQPIVWVYLVLALALVPLMARASPTLELEPAALVLRLVTRWSALARLVGAVVGIALLSNLAPLRSWLPRGERLGGEAAALLLVCLAAALPLCLGGLLARPPNAGAHTTTLWAQLAADAHLAAIATLLLRARLAPRLHAFALFLLVWILPACLPATLESWMAPLLDPNSTEQAISSFGLVSPAALRSFTVVAGLLLAAALAVRDHDGPPPE